MPNRRTAQGKSRAGTQPEHRDGAVASAASCGACAGHGHGAGGPDGSAAAQLRPLRPATPAPRARTSTERAAAGDYRGAWALATDNYRSQVGGYQGFVSQSSDLESVDFTRLETTSQTGITAQVDFADVAATAAYTDHCSGSFGLVSSGGQLAGRRRYQHRLRPLHGLAPARGLGPRCR